MHTYLTATQHNVFHLGMFNLMFDVSRRNYDCRHSFTKNTYYVPSTTNTTCQHVTHGLDLGNPRQRLSLNSELVQCRKNTDVLT